MNLIATLRRKFSQDRLFWFCAAIVIVVVPVLMAVAWRTSVIEHAQEDANQREISQSWVRRSQIDRVALTLKDAEASQRGYVITGEPRFLRRNLAGAAAIGGQIGRLEQAFAADPAQAARVRELRRLADAKFAEMKIVRNLRDQQGLAAAAARVAAGRGEALMEAARALTEQMTAAEAQTLARELALADRQTAQARAVTNLSFALVLVAIVAAAVMAFRYTGLRTKLIERVQAESERRQTMFDAAMDAIITFDPHGAVETINRAGERMFGYAHGELSGRDISTLAARGAGEGQPIMERLRNAHYQQAGQVLEAEARRADGSVFPVDVNLGEMQLPDGVHLVAVIRDITERKKVDVAKAQFVSTVSHELRTPLTSIAGSLGLLTGGAAGALPDRAARLVTIAESNSRRLIRLINDILDIERIQAGKLALATGPVDFGDVVQSAVDAMAGFAAEAGVEIICLPTDAPLIVHGDADRLTQVVTNLLSNAAKFSPPGGQVRLDISRKGASIRLSVQDQGQGVPAAFRDRIFSRFAQADASNTRQRGGTGLGLAISRDIVERHGGRIWYDSPPGQGATFFVELPAVEAAQAAPAGPAPRLLLCEDDPVSAKLIGEALRQQGFQVDVRPTLAGAREALAARTAYEALLLDLRLPDGSGLDLLKSLRSDAATRALPVIVISGDAAQEAAAGSLGLVDWIEKPLDLARLRSALQQVVDHGDRPLVMHIDDDPDLRELVVEAFGGRCRLIAADSVKAARDLLASVTPDLVILDVGLPDGSGLDLLPDLTDRAGQPLPVVVFSAQGLENPSIAQAVDTVLLKSRASLDQLVGSVRRLASNRTPELHL